MAPLLAVSLALLTLPVAALAALPNAADSGSAATVVAPSPAKKEAAYFPWETIQLTDSSLAAFASSNPQAANLVSFADPKSNCSIPKAKCKTYPGDENWPSDETWQLFNKSLGGVLIKTVPLAAPCYPEWPEYDAARCDYVTENWGDPHLQYAYPLPLIIVPVMSFRR
jgi:hypothetical protein